MSFRHPFNFIMTRIPRLVLRPFHQDDGAKYYELVRKNRAHLIQYGDYEEIVDLSLADMTETLVPATKGDMRYGAYFRDALVGRVELNSVPRADTYVLGYWVDQGWCGRGFGYAVCRAAIKHAKNYEGAKQVWAMVRHDNLPSLAIMQKLDFVAFERMDDQVRLRLDLTSG